MISKTKKLKTVDIAMYSTFLIILFLILLFGILSVNKVTFLLSSIEANLFLIIIIKNIINKLNLKFSKKEIVFLILITLLIYVLYFMCIYNRKFIYYWDFSCYYNIQVSTKEAFNINLFQGIKSFISTTWTGEYGNLISFFPEVIFNFTSKTINAFLLSCVFVFVPYLVLSFSIFIKSFEKKNTLVIPVVAFLSYPILHAAFMYGQPDLFGLVFVFLLISLTISYGFKKLEIDRCILIIILTFLLLICRRWYLYWIISYYVCYVLGIIIRNIKNKKGLVKVLKNLVVFGLCAALFFVATLFPFIKNTIINNYSSSYSFYMAGGLFTELKNQFNHVGILPFVLILIGFVYGVITKKYRLFSILSIIQFLIIIYLFTRVQNMGIHHSLLFTSIYTYFVVMCILFGKSLKKHMKIIALSSILVILLINFAFAFTNGKNKLFTDVKLKVNDSTDYNEIRLVSKWLKTNLNKDNKAYMIAHNNIYNPDKFRNYYMPDLTISKYLPYGSAIIGVDKFPVELFDSKYIITMEPYISTSVDGKYNSVFNKLVNEKRFSLVKKFDMNNGYYIYIYERKIDVDKKEINMYLEVFKDESNKYPGLYREVIEDYVSEKEL